MKKLIFIVPLILILLSTGLLAGCARIVALEPTATREFDITGFTNIELGHTRELGVLHFGELDIPIQVEVIKSDTYKVSLTANSNIFDFIDVSKSGNALVININRQKIANSGATIKAQVSMPEIAGLKVNEVTVNLTSPIVSSAPEFTLDVSGTGRLDINMQTGKTVFNIASSSNVVARGSTGDLNADVSGASSLDMNMQNNNVAFIVSSSSDVVEKGSAKTYSADVSGAGTLNLNMEAANSTFNISSAGSVTGQLKCADIGIDSSGASRIDLTGSGANANIKGSSSSHISLSDFPVNDAGIVLSGASQGEVTVNGRLDVNLSSSSTLTYGGNPTTGTINVSGASQLIKK
jgi:hypothetical protein